MYILMFSCYSRFENLVLNRVYSDVFLAILGLRTCILLVFLTDSLLKTSVLRWQSISNVV